MWLCDLSHECTVVRCEESRRGFQQKVVAVRTQIPSSTKRYMRFEIDPTLVSTKSHCHNSYLSELKKLTEATDCFFKKIYELSRPLNRFEALGVFRFFKKFSNANWLQIDTDTYFFRQSIHKTLFKLHTINSIANGTFFLSFHCRPQG